MTRILGTEHLDSSLMRNAPVAVVGYGSQGRAHALNLRDDGQRVAIGLRRGGASSGRARDDGFDPREPADVIAEADVVAMLVPDLAQPAVHRESVLEHIKPGALLVFAHGFALHHRTLVPRGDIDVVLVAPKGPGELVRRQYEEGFGVPCLLAVHRDATGKAEARALAYAHGIGGTRAGVLVTTVAEETETDLFGEQAVLCGGVTELVVAGFETLVAAGYQPEVAYFECLHELELIVRLLHEGGLARMHRYVSETARWGDVSCGPRIIDEHVRENMRRVLEDVRSGEFARGWLAEHAAGRPNFERAMAIDLDHPIEHVGRALRARMEWLATSRAPGASEP